MNEQTFKDAYESVRPDQTVKERMLENILSAASDHTPVRKDVTMKKTTVRRTVILAAVLCVLVMLSVAAYANGLFDLQDLIVGNEKDIRGYKLEGTFLSLQGLSNSNAVQGGLEWYEFENAYDPGYEIYDTVEDTCIEDFGWKYTVYGCYTQEMVDKLEEICVKYGLTLHGQDTEVQQWDGGENVYKNVGIEEIFSETEAECAATSGYYFADGSFHFDGQSRLNREDLPWKGRIDYQFRRVIKNSLDTVHLNIGDVESYTQWNYTTQDGTKVLLAIGPSKGLVIAELEESIVNINVLNVDDSYGELSQRSMEAFAETFAFANIP